MSNIKKQTNCILKYFEDYTDEELISMIESKSKLYSRLIDSEEKAIHILNNHARFFIVAMNLLN